MKLATETPAARFAKITANIQPGGGYEANYHQRMANLCREEYARTLAFKEKLMAAHLSGFIEVTVRTGTGSIAFPLLGERGGKWAQELYVEMAEILGSKLGKLECDIVQYERDSESDEADEREGSGYRAETLAFCLPMRPLSDEEFLALPAEARRAYDEHRAEQVKAA